MRNFATWTLAGPDYARKVRPPWGYTWERWRGRASEWCNFPHEKHALFCACFSCVSRLFLVGPCFSFLRDFRSNSRFAEAIKRVHFDGSFILGMRLLTLHLDLPQPASGRQWRSTLPWRSIQSRGTAYLGAAGGLVVHNINRPSCPGRIGRKRPFL